MLAYDVQLAALSTRIDGLDSIMATHATVMADVRTQLAALSSGAVASKSTVSTTTVAITSPAINDVAREMRLRDEKKLNIIVFGFRHTPDEQLSLILSSVNSVSSHILFQSNASAKVTKLRLQLYSLFCATSRSGVNYYLMLRNSVKVLMLTPKPLSSSILTSL